MTINIRESPKQEFTVHYSDPTSKRVYIVDGTLDRSDVVTKVGTTAPILDTIGSVTRFFDNYHVVEKGGGAWEATVEYRKNPSYWELSVDTSGGTAKVLQSISTVRSYTAVGALVGSSPEEAIADGYTADFKRAIGVTASSIEGVDVVIPKFDFSINYKLKMSSISSSYLMTIYDLTGKVNNATYTLSWKGQSLSFNKGDLRFMGAPCKQTRDDELDITYRFSAIKGLTAATGAAWDSTTPYAVGALVEHSSVVYRCVEAHTNWTPPDARYWEQANITIGDSDPIVKEGWQYLWVRYRETVDGSTNSIVKVPEYIYVEQVQKYGNFQLLGIA